MKFISRRFFTLFLTSLLLISLLQQNVAFAYNKDYTAYMIGNAHIDTAWKWLLEESAQECYTTFNRQIDNMNNNADFKFSTSASQHYKWVKEYYPQLYNDIKAKINGGQWEVVGGQVVEPDLNVPSGEALVRQFLYGQKFFKEEFGDNCQVGWVPDVFGFNGQLPQILKKSGINYFVTTKLNWNDTTTFPYELFKWQGIDGSEVVTYKPMKDYTHTYSNTDIENSLDKPNDLGVQKSMCVYGQGDHGGGPSQYNIDQIRGQDNTSYMPSVKFKHANEYFDNLTDTEKDNLPTWSGEMYFEKHRGVYTTHGSMKKYERKSEILAEEAEKYSTIASWLGTVSYPQDKIEKSWDKILTNHMHDILPGSSWMPVYDEAWDDYEVALNNLSYVKDYALKGIASRADTNVSEGIPILVFNPLSWDRSDRIEMELVFTDSVDQIKILDSHGQSVPCQILEKSGNKATVIFEAASIPSIGFSVYEAINTTENLQYDTGLSIGGQVIENDYLRVELSSNTGNITRIYDKVNQKEVIQPGKEANELHSYYDRPDYWHAWDLESSQFTPSTDFTVINGLKSITEVESGPVKSTYKIVRNWSNSSFTQYITLYSNSDRVDIKTVADWYEGDKCLKVSFPMNVSANQAAYDIAYGTIDRSNGYDAPKFEVPGHKWADLSENNYGVSIINDSKYGWDTMEANRLRLTLLRGPSTPQYNGSDNGGPRADQGTHQYTYSIYPHGGDWKEANSQREAFELNYPLSALQEQEHNGALGRDFSFVSVNEDNIIITVLKKAENSQDFILRAYEAEGASQTSATFNMTDTISSIKEINLIEEDIATLTSSGNSFSTTFSPYEIKSFKINLQSSDYADTRPATIPVDLSSAYNLDGISKDSQRSDGDLDGQGNTFAAELMPDNIVIDDIDFQMGSISNGDKNFVEAGGQRIDLPNGTYRFLYLLALSTNGDSEGDFEIHYADGSSVTRTETLQDWKSEIGGWMKPLKTDEIGYYFTHYHKPTGDEMVHDNYLYVYRLPLNSSKQVEGLTLPNNHDIKIAAMTFANGGFLPDPDMEVPSAVTGLSVTEATIRSVDLNWQPATDNTGVEGYRIYRDNKANFAPSSSNFIATTSDTHYRDQLNSYDTYYYKVAAYDEFGNMGAFSNEVSIQGGASNVAINKATTASGNVATEPPEKAVDGTVENNSKWCATGSEPHWLQVDLGQVYEAEEFVIKHAEMGGERASYNTKDFKIQLSNDGSTWQDAVTVTGNTVGLTNHAISKTDTRYVRLYITDATNEDDQAARIYELEVYARSTGTEPPPVELPISQNKPATASSNVAGEDPYKAVDGTVINNSKWCATGDEPHWLQIDLENQYQINKVIIMHAESGGETSAWNTKAYQVQVSDDAINWTDIVTIADNTSSQTNHLISDTTARYVRLYITDATDNSDTAARIYEFQVFGEIAPTKANATTSQAVGLDLTSDFTNN